jgi:hypothetical protein
MTAIGLRPATDCRFDLVALGFGPRGGVGLYDRGHAAASRMKPAIAREPTARANDAALSRGKSEARADQGWTLP